MVRLLLCEFRSLLNGRRTYLPVGTAHIKSILQYNVNRVNRQEPDPLPALEAALFVYGNEDPERPEYDQHGRKVKIEEIGRNGQGFCRGRRTDDK